MKECNVVHERHAECGRAAAGERVGEPEGQRSSGKKRARLYAASLALAAAAVPLGARQDAAALQGATPPPNGIWLDSLDLTGTPIRRPRPARGQTTAPPLTFTLGGAVYAHA